MKVEMYIIMHGMIRVKVIDVQQTRVIHKYKNTKEKLFKTDAANICSLKRADSNN
jgi:hypothetical protein